MTTTSAPAVVPAAAVINEVRRLAAAHPDNVYRRPGGINGYCSYTSGVCTDGSCGCLFGQAFINLGVTRTQLPDNGVSAHTLLFCFDPKATERQRCWCSSVQSAQDNGKTWGHAVARADERYPLTQDAA